MNPIKFNIILTSIGQFNVINESTGTFLRTKAGSLRYFKTRNSARKEISRERSRLAASGVKEIV